MTDAVYRRRRAAVSRGEREWRVEGDALVSQVGAEPRLRVRWAEVTSVRLAFAPTRFKPWRYVFEINARSGKKITLDNAHYVRLGEFEDRSASYTPFVRAALARVARANPKARALVGETPARYFFLLLAALVGLGGAAFALVALKTPIDTLPYPGLVKLAIILLMLPVFARWVLGAAPKGVALDAVPARALPPERAAPDEAEARA